MVHVIESVVHNVPVPACSHFHSQSLSLLFSFLISIPYIFAFSFLPVNIKSLVDPDLEVLQECHFMSFSFVG